MGKKVKKFNPRPKIDYPPLTLRTWVPPYLRPKRKRKPKYEKPQPGVKQPLTVSALIKIWHQYTILEDRIVLLGHFSETYKRFLPRSNGFQTPCNCVVAIVMARLRKEGTWDRYTVDEILLLGDQLYLDSTKHLDCKRVTRIALNQVFDSFFVGDTKVTITIKGKKYKGKLFKDMDDKPYLQNVIKDFFNDKYQSGIIEVQNKFIAFWQTDSSYFLFDPSDHDHKGHPWEAVRGLGYAVMMKLASTRAIVDIIHENMDSRTNSEFVIWPCEILRTAKINLQPPELSTILQKHCTDMPHDSALILGRVKYSPRQEENIEEEEEQVVEVVELEPKKFPEPEEEDEFAPEVLAEMEEVRPEVSQSMIPLERPKPESVTHFECLIYEKVGILRASTHQEDERFTRLRGGVQSIANAFAALTMLRIHKTKLWIRKIVDEILILGEQIYKESTVDLPKGSKLKVTDVEKKITLKERSFTPDVEEYAAVGRLQSRKNEVLDLLPTLEDFFKTHDMCVIVGPLTLAVWLEHGYYYFFDPNERDKNGLALIKYLQIGSDLQVMDVLPGVACVMWFKNLKDLVDVYMNNVEKKFRQEPFVVSRVEIKDFVSVPDPWYNFQGLCHGKWILRGTFNQNDRRFEKESRNTQCTAMACMALAYSRVKHTKRWSRDDLDEVLIQGDTLHKNSVKELRDKRKFVEKRLLVDEVQRTFMLEGKQIRLDIRDCILNGLLDAKNNNDTLNLRRALTDFFRDFETGVVSSRGIAVAVWKTDGIYYYMDSHTRDENGMIKPFGTSCVIRTLEIDDMARAIETNLSPQASNLFNISSVGVNVWEVEEGGLIRPPLYNYAEIDVYKAILQSSLHERSPDFKLNCGKQTVPMCLAAAGMITLYPSALWTNAIVDEILWVGDQLYTDTMIAREQAPTISEADDIDEVYPENCLMNYCIGLNRFELKYRPATEGNFAENFEQAISEYLAEPAKGEEDLKPLLIASDVYTVLTWVDNDIYYLFDPKPRDNGGQVLGKEEWSLMPIQAEGEGEDDDVLMRITEMEGGGDTAMGPIIDEMTSEQKKSVASQVNEGGMEGQVPVKHSARYWRSQENAKGKALAMFFTTPEKIIEHIVENIPITKREDMRFKMIPITVSNVPDTKVIYDPNEGTVRPDNYAGNWYEFMEIDHGKWILRASIDLTYELFPAHNRGRQAVAMAYVALGYVNHYVLKKFKSSTVNEILKYGDRLHSATRLTRYKEIKSTKALKISENEIENLLNRASYGVEDIARSFCVNRDQTQIDITPNHIIGDLWSKEIPELPNVTEALQQFFEENRYGLISSKGVTVAVWKGAQVYYMFDPYSRSACGSKCFNGEACITRFIELNALGELFTHNVGREGKNSFVIHRVEMRVVDCPKEFVMDVPEPEGPKFNSFVKVMPGKWILCGTISQDDPKFNKVPNAQAAAVAVVALTMTLIHKASTWTKPIVDDIINVGDELHASTVEKVGYRYNPWEQNLTLAFINRDYNVGTLKANCELRTMDQKGIIQIKHPKILNLRQGIERFFDENTHGVIETDTLTVAIWEEEDRYPDPNVIYMYDPNPRGPYGMPQINGAACVVTFENAELAADHFINCLSDPSQRSGQFLITPVEIVVGNLKTKRKKPNPCRHKPAAELPHLCPDECEKKRLRKMAAEERKRKKEACQAKLGRNEYYDLGNGIAILRGTRCQNSKKYSEWSRGNQDIPNCLAAFVVHRLVTINRWHYKHIDMILDVGDALYKDSYINYSPVDPKLGFPNVLRKVFIKDCKVSVNIYKPVICKVLNPANLEIALMSYFQQETFCILNVYEDYVCVFFKEGMYYIFDPHERDIEGDPVMKQDETGWACSMRFSTLPALAQKYTNNILKTNKNRSMPCFVITLVTMGTVIKVLPTEEE